MTRTHRGFTLIELLAVVTIIGILATLAIIGIANTTKRARDSRRQSDLANVKKAIELYAQDNGEYPSGNYEALGETLLEGYLTTMPQDPLNNRDANRSYLYVSNGDRYVLYSDLEHKYNSSQVSLTDYTCNEAKDPANAGNGIASGSNGNCFRLGTD